MSDINDATSQTTASETKFVFISKDGKTFHKVSLDVLVKLIDAADIATGTNGQDGKDGKDGEDGYTPIKGVDYFTEADIEELIAKIQEAELITSSMDVSNWSNGKWTETLADGSTVNHTVTFDSNGNPSKIDDTTIKW